MYPHPMLGEPANRRVNVHRVATQPIKLGDHKDVALFQLLEQEFEPLPFAGGPDPDAVSSNTRLGSTTKPAALISLSWFSGVCSAVLTRQYANILGTFDQPVSNRLIRT